MNSAIATSLSWPAIRDGVRDLMGYLGAGQASFLYSSKEHQLNNAVALREYVLVRLGGE